MTRTKARVLIIACVLLCCMGAKSCGGSGGSDGGSVSCHRLERLWVRADGPVSQEEVAAAVAMAESGGDPGATNNDSNGTTDEGLWQDNTGTAASLGIADTYSRLGNARLAVAIYNAQGWSAWTTYNSGAYEGLC